MILVCWIYIRNILHKKQVIKFKKVNKQDNNKSQIQTELSTIVDSSSNLNEDNEIDTSKANILGHPIKLNEQQYNYCIWKQYK